ncbi:MAG: sugar phosphate nucleotidyltransferase [Chitinophagales bacterium]|nr:sugar phosphate nucleotidyltransferase [Chitinophagales bacterium]
MNIIIPMAGWGTRLRPHTLTVPKPLLPVAGKPIVFRLAEDLIKVIPEKVENIVFIIRPDFGTVIEQQLRQIGDWLGVQSHIAYQEEALGTAHAVMCAKQWLIGRVIVAFADTLFRIEQQLDISKEGIIWVQKVEDPRPFGVVKLNEDGVICDFVEKPEHFVSNLAIIGIYFFQDGETLSREIRYLLDNHIKHKGEYQLTDALKNMKDKGVKFYPGEVAEWLDCGNKDATLHTNARYLEFIKDQQLINSNIVKENCVIIPPCFIDEGVQLINSIVGPHVSIGKKTRIENSIVKNSIVQSGSHIKNYLLHNTMIGNNVSLNGKFSDLSIGDFSVMAQ